MAASSSMYPHALLTGFGGVAGVCGAQDLQQGHRVSGQAGHLLRIPRQQAAVGDVPGCLRGPPRGRPVLSGLTSRIALARISERTAP